MRLPPALAARGTVLPARPSGPAAIRRRLAWTIARSLLALTRALRRARAVTRRSGAITLSAETILAALMSLPRPLRLPHRSMPASPIAVTVRLAMTGLPHREFRFFPFRRLPFGAWQRRPNQPAMHRTVVFTRPFVVDVLFRRVDVSRGFDSDRGIGLNGRLASGIEFVRAFIGP
jgi:hypothetical protein